MRGEAGSQAPEKKSQLLSLPGKQILGPQVARCFQVLELMAPKLTDKGL